MSTEAVLVNDTVVVSLFVMKPHQASGENSRRRRRRVSVRAPARVMDFRRARHSGQPDYVEWRSGLGLNRSRCLLKQKS